MTEFHVSWMMVTFYFFGERIIFSSSSQPWPNNQHFNAYQYIHIRACFFTWGKARGVPDDFTAEE
jgi:hypothetical protein